jgi:glycerol kinase
VTALLAIDVGTTSVRAAIVDDQLRIRTMVRRAFPPATPFPGLVEFDAAELARLVLDAAAEATAAAGEALTAVGITNQRASTIVWDRATGDPIAPALGWQDLRTVGECLAARAEHDLALAPNQSATKLAWILANTPGAADRDLAFGTVDTWLAWQLSGGEVHVTDPTNAAITGLLRLDGLSWDDHALGVLGLPAAVLPRVVDTVGVVGTATAIPGGPPIAALVGDQQASLVGQGCVIAGRAKVTFGTGGILDVCGGTAGPASARRDVHGSYPVVAWSRGGTVTWGAEAIMLAAGMNVDWLREDLGLIATSEESHELASSVPSADGVVFVPALLGLGTPHWDYGARGTLLGVTRGTTRAHVVRAVLEGVAQRGADLVEATEADTGLSIGHLRVDGGMSTNPTFTQALADACRRPVEVSPVVEATATGAAFLAGLATGVWGGMEDADQAWTPARVHEPGAPLDRAAWARAVERAAGWIPELTAIEV